MTWVRNTHTVKFGGESVSTLLHPFNDQNNRGAFFYTGIASGNEYADFLLSQPATKQFSAGPGELLMREQIWGGFFDDTWRASKNLTVEYGVRYEAHFLPAAYNLNMVSFWPDRYKGVGRWRIGHRAGKASRLECPTTSSSATGRTLLRESALHIASAISGWSAPAPGIYYDGRTGQIAQQTSRIHRPSPTPGQLRAGRSELQNLKQPDNWTFVDPGYSATSIPFPTRRRSTADLGHPAARQKTDRVLSITLPSSANCRSQCGRNGLISGTKGTYLMATQNINPLIPQPDVRCARYPGIWRHHDDTAGWRLERSIRGRRTVKRRFGGSTFQHPIPFRRRSGNGNESARFFTNLYPAPLERLSGAPRDRELRTVRSGWPSPGTRSAEFRRHQPVWQGCVEQLDVNGFFVVQSGIRSS